MFNSESYWILLTIGPDLLCQHNFEHNWPLKALSITLAYIANSKNFKTVFIKTFVI